MNIFIILLIMLLQLSHYFIPFITLAFHAPSHQQSLHLSSCPQVLHISSLASPFPIVFLTSSCLFCSYHLCFLFPVPFPLFSPLHCLLITLHGISISMILFLFQLFAQFPFVFLGLVVDLSLIHISEPTRLSLVSRMPSSA